MRTVLILILAVLFRFVYLGTIPNAISGDELHYALTAKSVFLPGVNITGAWNPLSAFLFRYPPGKNQAELPYFLHLLSSAPFGFSLFWAKLPFAILSVGVVLLLYGIAKELFGKTAALAIGLIASVNPWLVVMGRTGYESTPATFFYLLALYLLLTLRAWNILWALLPLLFGFYSYIGTKLILLPFVALAGLLGYNHHKGKYLKQYLLVLGICLLFTVAFIFLLKSSGVSRMGELLLPNSVEVKTQVDEIRRTAIASPMRPLLVNKYVVYLQMVSSKLFRIFSPTYLFVEGDQFFLPGRQSFFYYLDFLFLIVGSLALYGKRRFYLGIVGLFIFVGTFPHLFYKTPGDFSGHLALMFPFIIVLIGAGIVQLRSFALWAAILLYIANIGSFAAVYFSQVPLVGQGDFQMRVLSRYLNLAGNTNTPITVYSNTSGDLLTKYLFYANAMNRTTMPEISAINTKGAFSFDGTRFTSCDTGVHDASPSTLVIYDVICNMQIPGDNVFISRLSDGGQLYKIFGDTVCSKYPLLAYAKGVETRDFNVEQLSEERFCTIYIHK